MLDMLFDELGLYKALWMSLYIFGLGFISILLVMLSNWRVLK